METTLLIQCILFQAYESVFAETTPEPPFFLKCWILYIIQGRNHLPSYTLRTAE